MIIGFTGRKGSGKDTAAQFLIERHRFVKRSFAGPLKRIARDVFELDERQVDGDLKEVPDDRWYGWTPRQIQQWIGTEAGRMGDFSWARDREGELRAAFADLGITPNENCWVDYLERGLSDSVNIVVTDVRFPNEAAMLRRHKARIWKVVWSQAAPNAYSNHPSEQFIDKLLVDYTFLNEGSILELHEAVAKVLASS